MVLTMRIQPQLYEELRSEAETNSRSIAAQAERRLKYKEPDASDVGRLVGAAIAAVESKTGATWNKDKNTREQCRLAVEVVIDVLLGSLPDVSGLQQAFWKDVSRLRKEKEGTYNALFGGERRSNQELEQMSDRLQSLHDARDAALSTFSFMEDEQS